GDGKRLVIVGVAQLARNAGEPGPGVSADGVEAHLPPAAVLRDGAIDAAATVVRRERAKATGLAQRADGQVPATVGRDQSAAVEDEAVADAPGRDQAQADRRSSERLGDPTQPGAAEQEQQQ